MEKFEILIPTIIHHPTIQRAESSQPFIVSNTLETTMDEMRNDHIIPVFTKDNERFFEKMKALICKVLCFHKTENERFQSNSGGVFLTQRFKFEIID